MIRGQDGATFDAQMRQRFQDLLIREDGQDLIEYSLLLAFILFTVIGLSAGFTDSIRGIVGVSSSQITAANTMAS